MPLRTVKQKDRPERRGILKQRKRWPEHHMSPRRTRNPSSPRASTTAASCAGVRGAICASSASAACASAGWRYGARFQGFRSRPGNRHRVLPSGADDRQAGAQTALAGDSGAGEGLAAVQALGSLRQPAAWPRGRNGVLQAATAEAGGSLGPVRRRRFFQGRAAFAGRPNRMCQRRRERERATMIRRSIR